MNFNIVLANISICINLQIWGKRWLCKGRWIEGIWGNNTKKQQTSIQKAEQKGPLKSALIGHEKIRSFFWFWSCDKRSKVPTAVLIVCTQRVFLVDEQTFTCIVQPQLCQQSFRLYGQWQIVWEQLCAYSTCEQYSLGSTQGNSQLAAVASSLTCLSPLVQKPTHKKKMDHENSPRAEIY